MKALAFIGAGLNEIDRPGMLVAAMDHGGSVLGLGGDEVDIGGEIASASVAHQMNNFANSKVL